MNIIELLRIIGSNLNRMKLRVAMTSAGVFIGTVAVILLVSIGNGMQQLAVSSLGDIGDLRQIDVYKSFEGMGGPMGGGGTGSTKQAVLNDKALSDFRALEGVSAVTPVVSLQTGGELRLNRWAMYANIQGIDPSQMDELGWATASGQFTLGNGQMVVGNKINENAYNPRTGQSPTEPLDLQGRTLDLLLTKYLSDGTVSEKRVRLRVAGVLAPSGYQKDYNIYLPLKTVMEINQWATGNRPNINRDGYDQAIVIVTEMEQATNAASAITQMGFQAFSPQEILKQLNSFFVGLQAAFGCIGGIALLVAAIGIANTMIMAILERTREIGLMKAVGATNRDVTSIFLGEAAAMGLLGGVLGCLIGSGVTRIATPLVAQLLGSMGGGGGGPVPDLQLTTPLWLILFALFFSTFIGLVSGIYPALRATRLDPIIALKYE